jgi:NitT/TauT family transport system substrate-binding protein
LKRIVAAAVALVCLFCVLSSSSSADVTTLTVAVGHSEPAAEVYYAQEMGFFERAGLHVQVTALANGAATMAALVSGALQFASADVLAIARAQARGIPVTIVAPGGIYESGTPTSLFVVAPDGPIRVPKDLEGKVVAGISLGGLEHLGQLAWLQANHTDASTIKFLELPTSEMVQALDQGRIAGATMGEPYLSAERSQFRVLGKDLDAIAPRFLETALVADVEWANNNPALAKKFANAIIQAGVWGNAHPQQAAAIMAKDLGIETARPHVTFSTSTSASLIQPLLDAAFKFGMLDQRATASSLVWQQQ